MWSALQYVLYGKGKAIIRHKILITESRCVIMALSVQNTPKIGLKYELIRKTSTDNDKNQLDIYI